MNLPTMLSAVVVNTDITRKRLTKKYISETYACKINSIFFHWFLTVSSAPLFSFAATFMFNCWVSKDYINESACAITENTKKYKALVLLRFQSLYCQSVRLVF